MSHANSFLRLYIQNEEVNNSVLFVFNCCVHVCYICPHRSPWSNKYDPPLSDGAVPSERLRRLEVEANHAFDTYRDL